MNFYVLTLFPEMISQGLGTSITGRAINNKIISLHTTNIRDFSADKHRRVDDYTYGGGAGMLMQPQPVYDAWKSARNQIPQGHKVRTIYLTPQGQPFTQKMAKEFAANDDLIFLCGHYEGIDERVLEETVTDYVSIGDYVLTGGELAAMVMIDAISRLVPGVLHNGISAETESFHGSLLEYPQYSRPEEWHGKRVPEVLLSGNPKQVDKWRLEQQEQRTRERRPDLYTEYCQLQDARKKLMKRKLLCMDMITRIDSGRAELGQVDAGDCQGWQNSDIVLIKDSVNRELLLSNPGHNPAGVHALIHIMKEKGSRTEQWKKVTLHDQEDLVPFLQAANSVFGQNYETEVLAQYVLTRKEKLPVTGLYRPDGKPTNQGVTIRPSTQETNTWIAYVHEQEAGRISLGPDGSMQDLYVKEQYRGQKIAKALETCLCNWLLEQKIVPYCQFPQSEELERLQLALGLYPAKTPVYQIKINE